MGIRHATRLQEALHNASGRLTPRFLVLPIKWKNGATRRPPKAGFMQAPTAEPLSPSPTAPRPSSQVTSDGCASERRRIRHDRSGCAHKREPTHPSYLVSSERVSLEVGRDKCQTAGINAGFLTGPRPYEATTKAGPLGRLSCSPLRSVRRLGGIPQGLFQSGHYSLPPHHVEGLGPDDTVAEVESCSQREK